MRARPRPFANVVDGTAYVRDTLGLTIDRTWPTPRWSFDVPMDWQAERNGPVTVWCKAGCGGSFIAVRAAVDPSRLRSGASIALESLHQDRALMQSVALADRFIDERPPEITFHQSATHADEGVATARMWMLVDGEAVDSRTWVASAGTGVVTLTWSGPRTDVAFLREAEALVASYLDSRRYVADLTTDG